MNELQSVLWVCFERALFTENDFFRKDRVDASILDRLQLFFIELGVEVPEVGSFWDVWWVRMAEWE